MNKGKKFVLYMAILIAVAVLLQPVRDSLECSEVLTEFNVANVFQRWQIMETHRGLGCEYFDPAPQFGYFDSTEPYIPDAGFCLGTVKTEVDLTLVNPWDNSLYFGEFTLPEGMDLTFYPGQFLLVKLHDEVGWYLVGAWNQRGQNYGGDIFALRQQDVELLVCPPNVIGGL